MSGLFVTFEGGEGAGKTTQIELLAAALRAEGRAVLCTREPGGDPVAEAIRAVLLHRDEPIGHRTETLLFVAARAQVVDRVIRPALLSGAIVLCDRYADSTVVYQGHARGLPLDDVRRLNAFATGGLAPDLTLLLDQDPEIGLARQPDRNRMESEDLAFHSRVREGYLAEAGADPGRYRVLDASRSASEVHAEVLAAVRACLSSRGDAS